VASPKKKINTILLVEDDPAEIAMAEQACASCEPPVRLVVVQDSEQALEWLGQAKGKDHLRAVVRTTDRGVMLRIEAEQVVLELVRAIRPDIGKFFLGP